MKTDKIVKWLKTCEMSKHFSTCGKRQYFSVILDATGHVVGTGYNGVPSGFTHCVDGGCPRLTEDSEPGSTYDNCLAVHSEANALLHSDYSQRQGGYIFVNGPPCFECSKLIVNSGLSAVFFTVDKDYTYSDFSKCLELFRKAKMRVRGFDSETFKSIKLN